MSTRSRANSSNYTPIGLRTLECSGRHIIVRVVNCVSTELLLFVSEKEKVSYTLPNCLNPAIEGCVGSLYEQRLVHGKYFLVAWNLHLESQQVAFPMQFMYL